VALLDSSTFKILWQRQLSGDLQAGFSTDGAKLVVYNASNGQVIELDQADGKFLRSIGTYDLGRKLRVGSGYFALYTISVTDSTIARIYRLSDGGTVRDWTDERVETLYGNVGFAGTGTNEYLYSRRMRIKVNDGTITKFAEPTTQAMYAGTDVDGNIAQEIWTRSGDLNGTFQNFRILRTDGTSFNLPAPLSGETQSMAGLFRGTGNYRVVYILSQRLVSGNRVTQVRGYRLTDGALVSTTPLTTTVANSYAAGHVPFGRLFSPTEGANLITFRPDPTGHNSLGVFRIATTSNEGQRLGEISGVIDKVLPTLAGAVYSSRFVSGGSNFEALASTARRTKPTTWTQFPSGSFASTSVPTTLALSPSGNVFAYAKTDRSVADQLTLATVATGAALATLGNGYNQLAFVNDTDLYAQRTTGTQIDFLRRSGASIGTVSTIADSSALPLTANPVNGKVAVTNYNATRKDVKVYDTAGGVQTIPLATQPIRAQFGADGVFNLVSIGAANQVTVKRYNVATATPTLLSENTLTLTYANANNVRASISASGRILALYAPTGASGATFGQTPSTLRLYRLPDLAPLATYGDFLPTSLTSLEVAPDGALVYAADGQHAPGYLVPLFVDGLTAPAEVGSGDTFNLTVKLPWRAQEATTVALTSTGGLTHPATVVVPLNDSGAIVPVKVDPTNTASTQTITATLNGLTYSINVSVVPPRPLTLTLNPTTVKGGTSSTATLTLIGVAPTGGLTVDLNTNHTAAQVPATVLVPEGQKSVTFTVTTKPVASLVSAARVNATANGRTAYANLKIEAPKVTALTTDVTSLNGGNRVRVTATLDGPAPTEGLTVTLTSSITAAIANTTIVIPAGASTANKLVTTLPVFPDKSVTLTGAYQSSSATAGVTVKAARVLAAAFGTDRVRAGETVTGTVLLSASTSANYPLFVKINGETINFTFAAGQNLVLPSFVMPTLDPGVYMVEIGNELGTVVVPIEIIE
jgi:antitoxin (DNA-binding transcriptional repressor) of toxin-antitoxin stability system